jgi:O-antigen/teichoic acid export membrane protein
MIKLLYNRWFVNYSRTGVVLKNTVRSVFLKGFSILVSFVLVPLCLKAVTQSEYGIILTITSIVSWFAFFDVGIGNGLRNKLGKAIAEDDRLLGRKYVSTAYFYVTAIFTGVLVLYTCVHPFVNWYAIMNISASDVAGLNRCMYLIIALFLVRLILQLIGVVLLADQQSYMSDAILPLGNGLTLVMIYVFYVMGTANFYNLIFSICGAPIIVLVLYSAVLFRNKYSWLKPSMAFVEHKLRKDLLSLGFKFFLLQIISLIIFSTSNFLIAQLFKMESVTVFNIGSRYYGISLMIFTILLTPMWGAFANAWYQGDKEWIVKAMRKMVLLNLALLVLSFVMFLYYTPLSKLWLGETIYIAPIFALTMVLYNFQMAFNNIFSYFLNGIGKINMQLYAAVGGGIICIPATILLAKYTDLGMASICVANMLSLLPSSFFAIIQVNKILKNRATGVWAS